MKIRKLYKAAIPGIMAVCVSLSAWADLRIELTPGSAAGHAEEISRASGVLKVTGAVDVRDFATLNSLPPAVTCLDMGDMEIAARGLALPDERGVRLHPAGRVPCYAFFQCAVREIVFPRECTLGEGVLACASTEKVTLPSETTDIPPYAFYKSAVKEIDGTGEVVRVGAYAFYGSSVESLSLPSVRIGGDYALACMPSLKEVALHPDASLGIGFLMDCASLVRVDGAPKEIPGYFVADSGNLDAHLLASHSSGIGDYALANLRSSALVLAPGLRSVGEGSMAGMTQLVTIDANPCGSDVPEVSETAFAGIVPARVTLYVAIGSGQMWKDDSVWGRFNVVEGLSSVDMLGAESGGITFAFSGKDLCISSPVPLLSVEVYDTSGRRLSQEIPGTESHTLGFEGIGASGVVMVRAANAEGSSSVSVMIR